MTDEAAAVRAWLDAHGLAEAELLHHLANHGSEGADRLTDSERRLLSALLETRRTVVPGYRPALADRPSSQDRPGSAEPLGLFDPDLTRPPEWAVVEPADHRAQRPVRPVARHRAPPSPARRPAHRDRDEERER
jgi:hypothetical protein